MTGEQFDNVVQSTVKHCIDTLVIKGKEYRRNDDPLHNFNVGTSITGKTREDVIWGFALKHFISIQDIKKDIADYKLPKLEVLDEKYGDLINYLLIEKASIVDKINEHEQSVIDLKDGAKIK